MHEYIEYVRYVHEYIEYVYSSGTLDTDSICVSGQRIDSSYSYICFIQCEFAAE